MIAVVNVMIDCANTDCVEMWCHPEPRRRRRTPQHIEDLLAFLRCALSSTLCSRGMVYELLCCREIPRSTRNDNLRCFKSSMNEIGN